MDGSYIKAILGCPFPAFRKVAHICQISSILEEGEERSLSHLVCIYLGCYSCSSVVVPTYQSEVNKICYNLELRTKLFFVIQGHFSI